MRYLVAIPVHNEIKYARAVLAKLKQFASDILMVDDGSTDGTADLLKELQRSGQIQLLPHATNQGYGSSVIDSFDYAARHGYDWVITMDCDEQHEPEMIPAFVRAMQSEKWDVISGSRYLHTRTDDDLPPTDRRAINAEITSLLNDLFGWSLTDGFCGYKAHRVSAMQKLALDETGYAFPLQFWPQVYHARLQLTELPVRLIYNDPNRHFGGMLDDAFNRMQHYLSVLASEIQLVGTPRQASKVERARHQSEASLTGSRAGKDVGHHALPPGHTAPPGRTVDPGDPSPRPMDQEAPHRPGGAHQPCCCSESDI